MSPEWLKHPNAKALVTEADGAYGLEPSPLPAGDRNQRLTNDIRAFVRHVIVDLWAQADDADEIRYVAGQIEKRLRLMLPNVEV